MPHAFGRVALEIAFDEGHVGVVVVVETNGELEAARADQVTKSLETWLDSTTFPARDLRLRPTDESTELGLGETGAETCLTEKIAT